LSVQPDSHRQRFFVRGRPGLNGKKLKASPKGEALLTSEGRRPKRADKAPLGAGLTSGGEAEAC
jgi:hypothetical protein